MVRGEFPLPPPKKNKLPLQFMEIGKKVIILVDFPPPMGPCRGPIIFFFSMASLSIHPKNFMPQASILNSLTPIYFTGRTFGTFSVERVYLGGGVIHFCNIFVIVKIRCSNIVDIKRNFKNLNTQLFNKRCF